MKIRYLDPLEVLVIHYVVVDQHFSDLYDAEEERGVKNPGALVSALYAPQHTFGGEDLVPDVLMKAAVLMRSLIQNHPFHNGNKRTAVIATILFLEDNGYELRVPDKKLIKLAVQIATPNSIPVPRIRKWLAKYTKKVHRGANKIAPVRTGWGDVIHEVKRFFHFSSE